MHRMLPAPPVSFGAALVHHWLPHRPCSAAPVPVAMEGADAWLEALLPKTVPLYCCTLPAAAVRCCIQ
jgi:hypothetical protein